MKLRLGWASCCLVLLATLVATQEARADDDYAPVAELIAEGQAGQAAELMEARLAEQSDDTQARYWLARAELAQIDDASVFRKPLLARSARENLEQVLEEDPRHVPAREALARYLLEAPAIVGGSVERAEQQADLLLEQDPPTGYRVKASIELGRGDDEEALAMLQQALASEPWTWDAQYRLVVMAVHRKSRSATEVLDGAESSVREFARQPDALLPLLDYQRGKLAAVGGVGLEPGRAALQRYLASDPGPDDPDLEWAEFRLAQVERQLGMTEAAQARLERLEQSEVPEDLTYALRDELRWHYSRLR
jgi:tetratricopeptide (TPR) repeat protein